MTNANWQNALAETTGAAVDIASVSTQSGGSIHDAFIANLVDGRRFFVKTHARAAEWPGLFRAERLALERLREQNAIRVPRPIVAGDDFIVIEAFTPGSHCSTWQESMGVGLAAMHRRSSGERIGFDVDNYLGTSFQCNAPQADWIGFWRDNRLVPQLKNYSRCASADDRLLTLGARLCDRLTEILDADEEPTVLLHGDLWSGNAAADENGAPIIFDPACYYGHREAEFGMMKLFGGFSDRCFSAYDEAWTLSPGSERRIAVYRLYHELNHLNLFGRAYYDTCCETLRAVL